jgi:hypothetical protein
MITAKHLLTKIDEANVGIIQGEAQLNLLYYAKAPAWAIELKFTKGKEIDGTYYATGSSGKDVKFYDDEAKAGTAFAGLKDKVEKITSYEDLKSIDFPGGWTRPDEKGYPPITVDGTDVTSAKVSKTISIKIGTKSVNKEEKKAEVAKQLRRTATTSTPEIPQINRLSRQFYKL